MDSVNRNHKISYLNRQEGSISGVKEVISLTVDEVVIDTEMGTIIIKGKDMHLKKLNLDKGEIDLTGNLDSLTYSHAPKKKSNESVFARLFS